MDQASHLRGKAVQLIVTHIQVQQVREVNEQLVGYVVNTEKDEENSAIIITRYWADVFFLSKATYSWLD